MNWRKWLYETLSEDATLSTLLSADGVVSGGSLDMSPFGRPFLVLRYVDSTPAIRDNGRVVAMRDIAQFWAYGEPGNYDDLDAILDRVEEIISGPVPRGDDTEGLVHVDWNGKGPELFDDQLKALTRWGSATLVGSRAA